MRALIALATAALLSALLPACGVQEEPLPRGIPIGRGHEFTPAARGSAARAGRAIGGLACSVRRSPRVGVHLEIFARGFVVIVPAGLGVGGRVRRDGAYVRGGRCTYPV